MIVMVQKRKAKRPTMVNCKPSTNIIEKQQLFLLFGLALLWFYSFLLCLSFHLLFLPIAESLLMCDWLVGCFPFSRQKLFNKILYNYLLLFFAFNFYQMKDVFTKLHDSSSYSFFHSFFLMHTYIHTYSKHADLIFRFEFLSTREERHINDD